MKKKLLFVYLLCYNIGVYGQLFTIQPSSKTNIAFQNTIAESKAFNLFTYEYIYNGSGVGLGDFNNDGLTDVFFSANMAYNKLYLNKGNFVFEDISTKANVNLGEGFNTGVTIADVNNDGWLDIYLCKSALVDPEKRVHNLYINNHDLTFTDRAKEYGLDDKSYSSQAYFYDMDLDGDLDMYLLNHPPKMHESKKVTLTYDKNGELKPLIPADKTYATDKYFENIHGKFIDKTKQAGVENFAFGLSAVIADFNDDNYPDIYVANDYTQPDFLYINNKNGTFTNKIDDFMDLMTYHSMGSDFADINNDGYDDLMVLDMLPESNYRQKQFRQMMSYDQFDKLVKYGLKAQFVKNLMLINQKGKGFSDISYITGMAFTDWSWSPMIVDLDNNGYKDVYITNGYYTDISNQDISNFTLDSVLKRLESTKTPEEVNNLYSEFQHVKLNNYFFANQGNLGFVKNPANSGLEIPSFSNSAVYGDLDNDGDLDLVVNNINQEAFVFKNNTIDKNLGDFVRFQLTSKNGAANTYGTKIEIITPDNSHQTITFNPQRGFMSCHEPFIHFGISKNTKATAIIHTKYGVHHKIENIAINQLHIISLDELTTNYDYNPISYKQYFEDITQKTGIQYTHIENNYNDFKQEPLLPKKFSRLGPTIAVADINGDKLDDIFIGGSKDNQGVFYIQNQTGTFSNKKQPALSEDSQFEDIASQYIDIENDGDMDLIVTSGGNDYPNQINMYPVRLYINDGNGNFSKADTTIFPTLHTSSKTIAIGDYDHDGDKDIFIGGHIVPGHYGLIPTSYLLKNEAGRFSLLENTESHIDKIGMVTDAQWIDVNDDGWEDLTIVGEWMPITFILNNKGNMQSSKTQSLDNFKGWWTKLKSIPIDNQGKKGIVFGNYSANSRYKGDEKNPMKMIVSDFDHNGSTDCVIGTYIEGKCHPIPIKDNLTDQMTFLKKRFNRYDKYSKATFDELFTEAEKKEARTFEANFMHSGIATFGENKALNFSYLPNEALFFPINAINTFDFDKDGDLDLLLSGNDYNIEIETGRMDAGKGLVLENKGNKQWDAIFNTGYETSDDVKNVIPIIINEKQAWIVGVNMGDLKIIQAIQ